MITPINLEDLLAEVERAKGLKDSLIAFLNNITPRIQAAVTAAVNATTAEDQAKVDTANAAIAAAVDELKANDQAITDALAANS